MKLEEFSFAKDTRKDTALVDFINSINKIINFGRYQMRVVFSVPTHTGDEGEFLLYVNGTIRRLYFYDITNATWHFIQWGTSGFGQSTIVATASLAAQTGDIANTTIYTPAALGTFRINVYMICSTAGTGTLSCTIGWTDNVGFKSLSPAGTVDLASTANGATGIAFMQSTATPIIFNTAIAGKAGSPEYSLFLVLEALT